MLLDNQIGFSGIFTSGAEAECQNCNKQRRMDTRYADVIPLTNMLVGCLETNDWAGGPPEHLRSLASLEPSDVVPFLTKRLEWRITTVSRRWGFRKWNLLTSFTLTSDTRPMVVLKRSKR